MEIKKHQNSSFNSACRITYFLANMLVAVTTVSGTISVLQTEVPVHRPGMKFTIF